MIYISEGYHKIKVKYFDIAGGAVMQLKWRPPSEKTEVIITDRNLYHLN